MLPKPGKEEGEEKQEEEEKRKGEEKEGDSLKNFAFAD